MEKIYEKIPSFNDHSNCKGHANYMLDCEYTSKEERDLLSNTLKNYINEKDIATSKK